MADIESNIRIDIDTSDALASLKNLQRQISVFQRSMAASSAANADSAKKAQRSLIDDINATGKFSANVKTIRSTTESFTNALEKNKLSMGEYFRYAGASTKTFGGLFKAEFDTIGKVARERVKDLQTQYISLGRDASGSLKSIAVRPLSLDMENLGTKTAIAAQKQQIFNQLLKQGSTNLLNFGKNTQWAGRQLMVGFTIPLSVFGSMAAKTFMNIEKQAIRFKRVYGDAFSTEEETQAALANMKELAKEFTKYGIAVEETLKLSADAAQMGLSGAELTAQVTQATRLAVLGEVQQQEALETTISVTNAFGVAADELAGKIDFLNAVENETITAISDLTIAIPKAGPVVKQLGGDVEDLAFFLTAMKEGGINASEGANALKSGLASMINPAGAANQLLLAYGINLREIVESNKGDVKGTVIEFAQALDTLDPLQRAKAIEQLFGKFQFSRISTLFQNVIAEGSQASRVLELANSSMGDLAAISAKELGRVEESTTFKFQAALEKFQLSIAPIGEEFLKLVTPILEFGASVADAFNNLDSKAKGFITGLVGILGGVAPVFLMVFGLLANGVANVFKGFATLRNLFLGLGKDTNILGSATQYMTQEQLEANAVAASLNQVHSSLIQTFTSEAASVDLLRVALERAVVAQQRFGAVPGARASSTGMKLATGIVSVPGPKGAGDIVPAMLSPGEAVIPAEFAKKYAPLIQGMISGNIPGYKDGVFLGMPASSKSVSKNRTAADAIYQEFLKSSFANTPPTEYGHQIAKTSGHSFPIFGLGGVYQKGNQRVFVKPVMDETAALAEIRGTQIARQAHGLEAPEQRIVVIRDPMDPKRERKFLALESELDAKFIQNEPKALFNEEQYFRQLVASLIRVDKDLAAANVFGNVVADVGPAGVFDRASGVRTLKTDLPSMEEQAMINLLGIKGGAKRAFAESTLGLMAGMSPQQYHQHMLAEIQRVLPALKQTVAGFGLSNPKEAQAYDAMIKRLEAGLLVDWSKFHTLHSNVKIAVPKKTKAETQTQNFANGGMVRGPGGPKDDAIPANLSNGEAVIDAETVKKNPGIIAALFEKKKIQIPGYAENNSQDMGLFGDPFPDELPQNSIADELQQARSSLPQIQKVYEEYRRAAGNVEEVKLLLERKLLELSGITDPVKLRKELNLEPGLNLLSSSTQSKLDEEGNPRKTGSQGIVKMHAGQRIPVSNKEDLRDILPPAPFEKLVNNVELAANLLDNLVFNGPAAANQGKQGKLTGTEFGGFVSENPELFMNQIADQAGLPPNHPDLMRFAQSVSSQLVQAGNKLIGESEFGQIIQIALTEEIDAVGSNTAVEVKKAFDEARKIGTVQVGGAGGRPAIRAAARGGEFSVDGVVRQMTTQEAYNSDKFPIPAGSDQINDQLVERVSAERIKSGVKPGAEALAEEIVDSTGEELLIASRSNSPSEETIKATNNMVDGVTETLINSKTEVAKATEQMLDPISSRSTQSRAFDQRKNAAILPERRSNLPERGLRTPQRKPLAPNYDARKAAREPKAPSVSEPLNQAVQQQIASSQMVAASNFSLGESARTAVDKMNEHGSKVMMLGYAASTVAGVFSMMGGPLGEVGNLLFQLSGWFTALITVTQLLITAKMKEALVSGAKRFDVSAGRIAAQGGWMATAAGKSGLPALFSNIGRAAKAFLGPLTSIAGAFVRFLPVIGLVAAAFMAFKFIADLQEEQRKKIEGLGKAAAFSAEELKNLGEKLNIELKTVDYTGGQAPGTVLTPEEEAGKQSFLKDDEFKTTYADQIAGIKDATVADANSALESLATQFRNAGMEQDMITSVISALAEAAGRTDLNLRFKAIKIDSASTAADVAQMGLDAINTSNTAVATNEQTFKGNPWKEEAENTKAINLAAGEAKSTIDSLTLAFRDGAIDGAVYNKEMSRIFDSLDAATGSSEMYDALAETMGIGDLVKGFEDVEQKAMAVEAAVAGIKVDPEDAKILKAGINTTDQKKIDAAAKVMKKYSDAIAVNATEQSKLNKVKEEEAQQKLFNEQYEEGTLAISNQITAIQEQSRAYDYLITNGWSVADATAAVADSNFMLAFSAAAGAEEQGKLADEYERLLGLMKKAPGGSGGAAEKTPLQQAIESLSKQRKTIIDASSSFAKLSKAGFSIRDAFNAAQDPILAAAIASTKVGTAAWEKLVKLIEKTNNLLAKGELKKLLIEGEVSMGLQKSFAGMAGQLMKAGLNAEQISEIMDDPAWGPAFAKDFMKDGVLNTSLVLQKIQQIKKEKAINLELQLSTKEGTEDAFGEIYDKAVAWLNAKKTKIELDFELATGADQQIIETAEDAIAAAEYKIDDLDADLTRIEDKESVINEAYEKRIEALDKVQKANEKIAKQQKNQLDLANALSTGDIAAAARAAGEMQRQSAEDAIEAQRTGLETARDNELGALTGNSGKTRVQIEKEIKDLKTQIFNIEEDSLEPARERIRLLEIVKREALDAVDAEIAKWESLQNQIDLNKISQEEYNDMLLTAKGYVEKILGDWTALDDKEITLTINEVRNSAAPSTVGDPAPKGGKGDPDPKLNKNKNSLVIGPELALKAFKASGLSVKQYERATESKGVLNVKGAAAVISKAVFDNSGQSLSAYMKNKSSGGMIKRYAAGGFAMGTDIVPAMLTPGEFVMRKYAVDKLGVDKMKAINNGSYSGDSVYNYEVNINVKSESNPNDIARVVIERIRQIDSQKLRRVNF
jgi:TP901 family phage tail tape measure protein